MLSRCNLDYGYVDFGNQLIKAWPSAVCVSAEELRKRFPFRAELRAAWRIRNLRLANQELDVLVVVDSNFPATLPVIAMTEVTKRITIPHLDSSGVFCLFPGHATFERPVGVDHLRQLFSELEELLWDSESGDNQDDFLREIHSYWNWDAVPLGQAVIPYALPAESAIWYASKLGPDFVFGPSIEKINSWSVAVKKSISTPTKALVLKLPLPLYPDQYPRSAHDVVQLADRVNASSIVDQVLNCWREQSEIPIVICFEFEGKVYSVATVIQPINQIHNRGKSRCFGLKRQSGCGRRKSAAFHRKAFQLASSPLPRLSTVQTDRRSLLNRTAGKFSKGLEYGKVMILGCGSVGAEVAEKLAQAGVGSLTLVDGESLSWQNIGRHVLGGSCVGHNKAVAMQERILSRFPDCKVISVPRHWQEMYETDIKFFDDYDIVVSLTADVASNVILSGLVRSGSIPHAVYGWLEPFAFAAHAIFQPVGGIPLTDMLESNGVPRAAVIAPASTGHYSIEPSCGATFQAYSSLEALNGVALISELVVDCLRDRLDRTAHRVWIGAQDAIEIHGLVLNQHWKNRLYPGGFKRQHSLPVPVCPE